ncbi:MAG: mechanosensitive ion channel [bacterium]
MGTIKKIGIKTTRITTLQGQELIIGNSELTSTRINNYKKMQKRRVQFGFGVTYNWRHLAVRPDLQPGDTAAVFLYDRFHGRDIVVSLAGGIKIRQLDAFLLDAEQAVAGNFRAFVPYRVEQPVEVFRAHGSRVLERGHSLSQSQPGDGRARRLSVLPVHVMHVQVHPSGRHVKVVSGNNPGCVFQIAGRQYRGYPVPLDGHVRPLERAVNKALHVLQNEVVVARGRKPRQPESRSTCSGRAYEFSPVHANSSFFKQPYIVFFSWERSWCHVSSLIILFSFSSSSGRLLFIVSHSILRSTASYSWTR